MKKIDKLDVISVIVIIAALATVIYAFIRLYQYRRYAPTQRAVIVMLETEKPSGSGHYTGWVKGADGQQYWYDGAMDIGFDSSAFETNEIKKANKEAQNIKPIEPIEHPDF